MLCRSEAGYGGKHVLGALVETHFIVKQNNALWAGESDPPIITRDSFIHLHAGGLISFDIFPEGWDKTLCLDLLEREGLNKIYFFGNETSDVSETGDFTSAVRALTSSGRRASDVLHSSWLFGKVTGSREFWDWGEISL